MGPTNLAGRIGDGSLDAGTGNLGSYHSSLYFIQALL